MSQHIITIYDDIAGEAEFITNQTQNIARMTDFITDPSQRYIPLIFEPGTSNYHLAQLTSAFVTYTQNVDNLSTSHPHPSQIYRDDTQVYC